MSAKSDRLDGQPLSPVLQPQLAERSALLRSLRESPALTCISELLVGFSVSGDFLPLSFVSRERLKAAGELEKYENAAARLTAAARLKKGS